MKKLLFIDRDGTLILEPEDNQIDAFEKLEFYPGVFQNLAKIATELNYVLVMVSNQDGLGTSSFPEADFQPVHDFIIKAFKNECIEFSEIHIDRSFPEDNSPDRKPKTGLLKKYTNGDYDLENSYVIGDRITDIQLAENLNCKAIWIAPEHKDFESNALALKTSDWKSIYEFLKLPQRQANIKRKTKETDIEVAINLDGCGKANISTGLKFFDHMLEQIPAHAGIDLYISTKGDLEVDEHHSIEDTAIALGTAFSEALGGKMGIQRYGFLLPMDDSLAQLAIDFGGRSWVEWNVEFKREKIGDMPTEMFFHFFKSFSDAAKCNLNIKAEGQNEHHKIESIFKALARAIRMAVKRNAAENSLPSTKGVL
ncbi:MAG: bifunctional histidinol-phosphatase/imidazoleglycerol-phosphate dehydratase HisB [Chitinophagales bacterium]